MRECDSAEGSPGKAAEMGFREPTIRPGRGARAGPEATSGVVPACESDGGEVTAEGIFEGGFEGMLERVLEGIFGGMDGGIVYGGVEGTLTTWREGRWPRAESDYYNAAARSCSAAAASAGNQL